MNELLRDLIEFHRKFGHKIGTTPAVPEHQEIYLRRRLVREEYDELREALDRDDLPSIAKEAIDLIYVTVGLMVAYGIDPGPIWKQVHRSNCSKDGEKRIDGKVTKGNGYTPPDIAGMLAKQGPLGESISVWESIL